MQVKHTKKCNKTMKTKNVTFRQLLLQDQPVTPLSHFCLISVSHLFQISLARISYLHHTSYSSLSYLICVFSNRFMNVFNLSRNCIKPVPLPRHDDLKLVSKRTLSSSSQNHLITFSYLSAPLTVFNLSLNCHKQSPAFLTTASYNCLRVSSNMAK